jgi:LysM repeat protein
MRSRIITLLSLSLISTFLFLVPTIYAEKMVHIVEKGDTLWDICEKYYGDANLWPKLWQMNPFITNPHLLKKGDVITLFESKDMKEKPKPVIEPEEKPGPTIEKPKGIDLSGIADLSKRGFLSNAPIESWGTIFATKNKKIILYQDDVGYFLMKKPGVKPGDEFLVGKVIGPLDDPVSNQKVKTKWYVFSIHGRIRIESRVGLELNKEKKLVDKENTYQATVISSFKAISAGDVIIPPKPTQNCLKPAPLSEPILANIVAAKDQRKLLGKYDIVYLNQGQNQSIETGQLFEIVKPNYAENPDPINKNVFKKNTLVLPDISIGFLLVVETHPDTATAVILNLKEPSALGAYIKSRSWDDHQDLLLGLQACTLD